MWDSWLELNRQAGYTHHDDEPPHIWFKPLKSPGQEYRLYDYSLKHELSRGDIIGYLDEYYSERELQV